MKKIPRIKSKGVSPMKRNGQDQQAHHLPYPHRQDGQTNQQTQHLPYPNRKDEQADPQTEQKRSAGPNIMPREKWDTLGGGDINQLLDAFRPEPPQQAQRQARSAKASALQEAIGQLGSVVGSAMGAPAITPTMRHRDHLNKYEQMLADHEDQKRAHEMLQLQQTISEDQAYRDYVTGRQAEERGADRRRDELETSQDHAIEMQEERYKYDKKREAALLQRMRERQAALNWRATQGSQQGAKKEDEEETTILQDPQTGETIAELNKTDRQWVRNRVLKWAHGPGREHLTEMDLRKIDDEGVNITERDMDRWMHMYFDQVPEVRERFKMGEQYPRYFETGPEQLQPGRRSTQEHSITFEKLPRPLKDSLVSSMASDEAARTTDKDKIRELLKAEDARTIEQLIKEYGL